MAERLPSLTALRAFEAAARHLSFAQAAAELHVTPAALSFQIKNLEAELGEPLFRRMNRAVALTEAGRALAPGLAEGFGALSAAWTRAKQRQNDRVLTVTAGPAFTAKWLAPRMYHFAAAHPEIELRFLASLRILDLARDEIDVAIRFGLGGETGVHCRSLIREWMTPMMAPALVPRFGTAEGLADALLIHDDSLSGFDEALNWAGWAKAAGVPLRAEAGVRFSQADHALDAAVAGAGVVMGRVSLAAGDLRAGRLVAPFETGLVPGPQFRFLCAEGAERRPHVAAFAEWMTSQMAELSEFEQGRRLVPAEVLG